MPPAIMVVPIAAFRRAVSGEGKNAQQFPSFIRHSSAQMASYKLQIPPAISTAPTAILQLGTLQLLLLYRITRFLNCIFNKDIREPKAQKKAIFIAQVAAMKKLGIVGFLMILAAIPIAQFGVSKYMRYLELQNEADQEAACIVCLGAGLTAADAKENLDTSMRYLIAVLLIGSVGIVLVGLNWRELIPQDST